MIQLRGSGAYVSNNTLNWSDMPIRVFNSNDSYIVNNTIIKAWSDYDAWTTGIEVYNSTNTTIINNSIEYGKYGILARNSSQIYILNNSFKQLSFYDKWIYGVYDYKDTSTAIALISTIIGFLNENREKDLPITKEKINYNSVFDINISGNIFDNNVMVFMQTYNTQNLSHDLSNYWYRKVQPNNILFYPFDFYIDDSYFELLHSYATSPLKSCSTTYCVVDNGSFQYRNWTGSVYNNIEYFQHKISKNRMFFLNINSQDTGLSYNLSLYNLTDQEDSQYCQIFLHNQSSFIVENVNEYNITLPPYNRTLIFTLSSNLDPKFLSIATTIDDINYSYSSTSKNLNISCEGTGNIVLTNMDIIKNPSTDSYSVYHNGLYLEEATTNDYTITSCSHWQFIPSIYSVDANSVTTVLRVESNIGSSFVLLSILVIVNIAVLIAALVLGGNDPKAITSALVFSIALSVILMVIWYVITLLNNTTLGA